MRRIFFALLLAIFAITPASAANFYWKASTTDLNAIAAPSAGDRGIVITDAGVVSYWTYSGSAWVQAFADLPALGPIFAAATSKTTPVDADEIPLSNSQSSGALNALSWANLKATLKTYFDGLYAVLAGTSSSTFHIGTGGPKLKNNSGTVELRNAADDAFADAKGKDAYFSNYFSPAENNGKYFGNWDNTVALGRTPVQGDLLSESGTLKFRDATALQTVYHSGNLVRPVTGPVSPTAGNLSKWDTSGQVLVDGPALPSGTIVGTTDTQTLSGKTLTAPKETVVAGGTCSTSYAPNLVNGSMFTLTLSGACEVSNPSNLAAGQSFTIKLTQSSTTAPTWGTAYKWAAGTAPTWSASATKYDVVSCASFDGSTLQCGGLIDVR